MIKRRVILLGSLTLGGVSWAKPVLEEVASRHFLVTYDSEGLRVKGRLFLPAKTPAPGVLINHDGISGVTASTQERAKELADQGFVVFAPSYRGEDGSQGEIEIAQGEVADVIAGAQFLRSRAQVNPRPLGLVGMSHGALISLLASARNPELFGAVVFAYGVANIYTWYQFLKDSKQLGKDPLTLKTYGQGPEDVPENFRRRHGLAVVPQIQCPVLIIQGQKDSLTPPDQGQELAQALKQAGKSVELKVYPESGHGFLIYRNKIIKQVGSNSARYRESLAAWEATVGFLKKHLT